jgi:hypothetical protein
VGYIRHDAIVVTSFDAKYLRAARRKADALGLPVSQIVTSYTNGYVSFLIAPDGSKEGWGASDAGDGARAAWKEWAHEQRKSEDLFIDWVHLSYAGDDVNDTYIVESHKEDE